MNIELLALNSKEEVEYTHDFDTIKEAKAFAKFLLAPEFWARRAESQDYGPANIFTVRLMVDGECRLDYFPKFYTGPQPE